MDVIAAIATGSAATAIGIVRVSGDGCFALCGRVFRAAGGRPFAAQEPRKMVFGEMLDRAGRVRGSRGRGGTRRTPAGRALCRRQAVEGGAEMV